MSNFNESNKDIDDENSTKPLNAGKKWTPSMVQQLTNYNNKSLSVEQIANKMGRTQRSIICKLEKMSTDSIPKNTKQYPVNHRKLWDDKQNSELLKYAKNDMTVDEICKQMGRTQRSVIIQYEKLIVGTKKLNQCSTIEMLSKILEKISS